MTRRRWPDAQLGEEAALDGDDLLFGVQDLGLVLLQLRSGEALGADQGLLALVVGGSVLQVGLADLDVKAEDVVELDLERVDAGALAFALLDLGDVVLAVAADVAKLVEFGVHSGWMTPPSLSVMGGSATMLLSMRSRTSVSSSSSSVRAGKARGREVRQRVAHAGQFGERCGQGKNVARIRRLQGDAAEQALDVENAVERAAQLLAMNDGWRVRQPRRRGAD